MSDLFKGFEQLLELAKALEEKIEAGEIKADMQIRTRSINNIPRAGSIPRPGNAGVSVGRSGFAGAPASSNSGGSSSASREPVKPQQTAGSPSLKDVGGLSEVIKELKELIAIPLKRPDLLAKIGLEPTRGVLLVGPPGTGKTLTARSLAEELGVNYIAIVGPEVIGKYYGEAEQRLRELFEKAAKSAPCLVFIDEIDSLAPDRSKVEGDV
jgi:transitional endoplasmic reticulum ATPase